MIEVAVLNKGSSRSVATAWALGCIVIILASLADANPPLLKPWTLVHPGLTREPILETKPRSRYVPINPRPDYVPSYPDLPSWEKAHAEWKAQLLPAARTTEYWHGVGLLVLSFGIWTALVWAASRTIARMSSRAKSEGMRRLSFVTAAVTAAVWLIFVASTSDGFRSLRPRGWIVVTLIIPIVFAVGFSAISTVDWVVFGFPRRSTPIGRPK